MYVALNNSDNLFNTYPVSPSTVSSIGNTCIRFPYLTSGHGCTDTTSDSRTLKLLRTILFIRIFSSGQVSSDNTIHTVSLRLLPFSRTVSPRKSWSSSILACDSDTTLLSSLTASSTSSLFGRSLRLKIAVARSSGLEEIKLALITKTNTRPIPTLDPDTMPVVHFQHFLSSVKLTLQNNLIISLTTYNV